jgi:hypothetical protein
VSAPSRSRPLLAISVLGACLLVTGCSHPVSVGRRGVVQVALTEYRLRPDDIVARAGQITFVAHNFGRLTHDLTIESGSAVVGSTLPIPPGGVQTLTLTLPAGRYTVASTIQSDDALGEHGSLTVQGR